MTWKSHETWSRIEYISVDSRAENVLVIRQMIKNDFWNSSRCCQFSQKISICWAEPKSKPFLCANASYATQLNSQIISHRSQISLNTFKSGKFTARIDKKLVKLFSNVFLSWFHSDFFYRALNWNNCLTFTQPTFQCFRGQTKICREIFPRQVPITNNDKIITKRRNYNWSSIV